MRSLPSFPPRVAALLGALLLLPLLGSPRPEQAEAPWAEAGWPRAFAIPRPSLPDQPAVLECSEAVPTSLRLRLHRVKDPQVLLLSLMKSREMRLDWEGAAAGKDPFDVLREAFLWGGRRAFTTVHRTATRALRDSAREIERLERPLSGATQPREGEALPLEGRPELEFLQELVPRSAEDQPNGIRLPGQREGLYLLEVLLGRETAFVPWMVTDLALLAEQDGTTLRVHAVSARDGSPRGGVQATLFTGAKALPIPLDAQGRGEVRTGPGVKRNVWAQAGGACAALSIEGIAPTTPKQRIYAFTERPLYRPGQEVFAKAILRRVEKGENRVAKGPEALAFKVLDPEDTEVAKGQARLLQAETGTYACSVQLPGAGRLGLHRIVFDGPEGPGQAEFKVEFFVKPAFAVTVDSPSGKVGLGDELRYTIQARYFYGAAVRNAKVEWYLYQVRPSRNWSDGEFGSSSAPAPELAESGEAQLDESGKAELHGLKAKEEGSWRLVAKVTDGSGQRNSGSKQVRCAKGDLVVFLKADRELAAPGEPFEVTARVLDLEGREAKVPVTLKAAAIDQTWRGKAKGSPHDASDPWNYTPQMRPGQVIQQAQGPTAKLTIPGAGLYLLVAEATDAMGRKVEALRPITVAAEGTPLPATPDLRANPDKREYRVGETARVLVRMPAPNLTLHWSLEGEELGPRHSRRVPGTSAIVEIPVTAAMQPNVWASFEIVAQGRRQLAEVPLRAPKVEKRLRVEVLPDKERYQPGERMRVAIAVTDHAGKPAAADLAVGVVDEAIYALSPELHPDPWRFFHPSRRHLVMRSGSTDWSFFDLLRRAKDRTRPVAKGEAKEGDEKVRKNFKDTAHWEPFVAAGSDGRATVELTLPDNLTAWRATATAVTADTRVGTGRSSRPASKPLQVSLTIPRTLARTEEARAIALVRNLSGRPLSGKVRLEVKNGTLKGSPEAAFSLQDQGEFRFALPLLADQVGTLTATARVEGGGLKDAEQQAVPVVEPLVAASLSGALVLQGGDQALTIPAPAGAQGEAMLVLTAVAGTEQLVLPSLPYLIQYPYGCVEQTLSSFMPNLLVADLVKKGLAPEIPWKRLTDLDRNIRDGVFKVYGYQLPNGGWGWYAPKDFGPDANPHTTGYAIQSLASMKRLGYGVDEKVLARGRGAAVGLFKQLAERADQPRPSAADAQKWPDPAADAAFVLLSLARSGEPLQGLLDSSADKALKGQWKGGHVLAMLTLACAEAKHPKAAALLDALEKAAAPRNGTAAWEGRRDASWWHYASGDVLPTIYALEALCLLKPQSPLIPQGEAFLASQHQGYGWSSTWSTSQAVELVAYLARARRLQWEGREVQARIEGGPAFDFRTLKRDDLWSWRSREPRPGSHKLPAPKDVKLAASGQGVLIWTYGYQVPGSAAPVDAPGASSGLRLDLKRQIWRLAGPQQTGDPKRGWVRLPWTGTLRQGEEAWMELDLGSTRYSSYPLVEIPIPAGLEPQVKLEGLVLEGKPLSDDDASSQAWNKPRIEIHPDRVTFLFQSIGPWSRPKARILLRAGMAGQYRLRPARLSLMSNETQWTTCDGLGLTILEGGSK